jgi:hypothetical protein
MRRVAQRFDALCRSINDRLFVDIEARVDEDRKAGLTLERAEDNAGIRARHSGRRRTLSSYSGSARRLTFVTSKTSLAFSRWITGTNGMKSTGQHDSNEIVLAVSCAEWQITTCEHNIQSGVFNLTANRFFCRARVVSLQYYDPAWLQERRNGSEEMDMDAPMGIVRTQISKILVYKMGRIGNSEIPLTRFRLTRDRIGRCPRWCAGRRVRLQD